jgi:Rrf2 family transcriptional regulator, iron-sulfur cluster assembly transcription factor
MLSNSCRYGIRAVIYLACQPLSKGKTGIKKISKDLDLPTPFLAKILQQLAKQKILSSSKGPHGGFSLLKDPHKITLLDIVNTIDGNDVFTNCVMHNGSCEGVEKDKIRCPLHEDYEKLRMDQIKLFSSKTIYDLGIRADNEELIAI